MLIDRQDFVSKTGFPASAENGEVFLYCGFSDLEIDGRGFDGALIGCKFENIDWYWGLFNEVLISKTKFVGCKFRGTSFVGCRFLDCEFAGCEFAADNVGGFCKFKDCVLVECKFRDARPRRLNRTNYHSLWARVYTDVPRLNALVWQNSLTDTELDIV